MTYINKIDDYTKKKRMISARVPQIYLDALYASETDVAECGLDSTISKIVSIAFRDALSEIKDKLGVDYLELEKFKLDIADLQSRLNPQNIINPEICAYAIKEQAIKIAQETGQGIDVVPVISEHKAEILHGWKTETPKRNKLIDLIVGEF